jgi:hypothetical protein
MFKLVLMAICIWASCKCGLAVFMEVFLIMFKDECILVVIFWLGLMLTI